MIKVHTIVNTILRSCTYILHNEDKYVYLIDCGDVMPILDFVRRNNKTVKGIFLTHCHYDHIYGINQIISQFPNAIIYGSTETIEGLKDPKINLSKYHGESMIVSKDARINKISESSNIQLFNQKIIIIETPGHDIGCLSFLVGNMLFTGDSYIPNLPVFTKWKRSEKQLALYFEAQIKKLLFEHNYTLYPGHSIR
jgi:glyoxylase-like metal-dependent hydrolase (beta-lactamase superfamily II)